MSCCILCQSIPVKRFTWVNSSSAGIGGGLQGGPMCEACMSLMWDSLSRFQDAIDSVTIWPIKAET